MFRKVFMGLAVLIIVFGGLWWFAAGRNTPGAAAKTFTNDLTAGKSDAAYDRLTAELTKGREAYWQEYIKQFASPKSSPTFGKEEQVIDTFNTYTDAEDPRRFTYTFHLKDKDYQAVILLKKEGKHWKVDEFYGSPSK